MESQLKNIQRILNSEVLDECPCCGKRFLAMVTYEGYGLCPDCDEEFIEKYLEGRRND